MYITFNVVHIVSRTLERNKQRSLSRLWVKLEISESEADVDRDVRTAKPIKHDIFYVINNKKVSTYY